MNQGRTIFAQLADQLPKHEFNRCVERYRGNHRIRSMSCWDQYLIMMFAQITGMESLREIALGLQVQSEKLYHSSGKIWEFAKECREIIGLFGKVPAQN